MVGVFVDKLEPLVGVGEVIVVGILVLIVELESFEVGMVVVAYSTLIGVLVVVEELYSALVLPLLLGTVAAVVPVDPEVDDSVVLIDVPLVG